MTTWTAASCLAACWTPPCSRSSSARTATATTSCAGCGRPGSTDVGDASVYGTLRRLYRGGALTSYVVPSDEGPHRRYYGITERGQAQLDEARETWMEFGDGAQRAAGDGGDHGMSAIGAPDYLQALERELADLAPDERADLLEEVEASLLELDDDPVARLGPPSQFAAELRESAGLPPVAPPVHREPRKAAARAPQARPPRPDGTLRSPVSWRRSGGRCARSWSSRGSPCSRPRRTRSRSPTTTRGCSSASHCRAGPGRLDRGRTRRSPAPARRCVGADRARPRARRGHGPAGGILLDDAARRRRAVFTASYPPPPAGLAYDAERVTNIYPYDRNGRLLSVRRFDESGRPLDVLRGAYNPNRAPVRTRAGTEVFNVFPIRYFNSDTGRVEDPNAAPPDLDPPRLVNSRTPSSP